MPRTARIIVPGAPHHVTQRGNRREDVFMEEGDYALYENLLRIYGEKHGLEIWAYCLMTNHVHIVAVPQTPESLSDTLHYAHQTYALTINRRERHTGHLWQGRFYSCTLDDAHLWAAVRYVENNPVRAGIVESAEKYKHSSAAAHCGLRSDTLLSGEGFPVPGAVHDWSAWLKEDASLEEAFIRARTCTGRPCGSDSFLKKLELMLDRPIAKRMPGRKKKQINNG